jgi:hypothetical protein
MWRNRWKWHLTDMHGKTGISQEARKHKERVGGFCPRWFALVPSRWTTSGKKLGTEPFKLQRLNHLMPLVQGRTAQPRNSAGGSFAVNQFPSVAAGRRATILRHGIQRQGAKAQRGKDARLPVKRIKMFAPSHLCVFALKNPSSSKPTSASANGAMSSAFRRRDEE